MFKSKQGIVREATGGAGSGVVERNRLDDIAFCKLGEETL